MQLRCLTNKLRSTHDESGCHSSVAWLHACSAVLDKSAKSQIIINCRAQCTRTVVKMAAIQGTKPAWSTLAADTVCWGQLGQLGSWAEVHHL